MIDDVDRAHLRRCVELARTALESGNQPFGSVLVHADGRVLFEDHNRDADGDRTRHPEFAIARWSVMHLRPRDRAAATVYTSGEHCPMCAAAHAWAGLGRVVYASSAAQLSSWLHAWAVSPAPVLPLPITAVAPGIAADGPVEDLAEQVQALQRHYHDR